MDKVKYFLDNVSKLKPHEDTSTILFQYDLYLAIELLYTFYFHYDYKIIHIKPLEAGVLKGLRRFFITVYNPLDK